jgi:hypothetical protein
MNTIRVTWWCIDKDWKVSLQTKGYPSTLDVINPMYHLHCC